MDNQATTTSQSLDPAALQKVPTVGGNGQAATDSDIKATILIVEDEGDAREIFVDLFSSAGYMVYSAVDGNDALAKLEADKGKVDLVMLDIIMPNKDGVETLEDMMKAPEKYGTPNVVMLTNIGGDAAVEKAIQLGAKGYLLKSETEPEQLLVEAEKFLNMPADAKGQMPVINGPITQPNIAPPPNM